MRWKVKIDDPDQAEPHEYELEADDPTGARMIAARQAILDDERGVGASFPPGTEITDEDRASWAKSAELVCAVAQYAVATPLEGSYA